MNKLPVISGKECIFALDKAGFYVTSSHAPEGAGLPTSSI
jgi:predicted RNA binding protein YcfA (HicA-like mRNA interferase family)